MYGTGASCFAFDPERPESIDTRLRPSQPARPTEIEFTEAGASGPWPIARTIPNKLGPAIRQSETETRASLRMLLG
jgi:hypothetical protein